MTDDRSAGWGSDNVAEEPQRLVALIVFIILAIDWFTKAPQLTRPGASVGGTGIGSGLIFAIGGATVWYVATRRASWWLDRGHALAAIAFSAAIAAGGSFAAIFLAVFAPAALRTRTGASSRSVRRGWHIQTEVVGERASDIGLGSRVCLTCLSRIDASA
jgi:hypothetical protein